MVLFSCGGGWLSALGGYGYTPPGDWSGGKGREGVGLDGLDYFCNGHPSLTPFFSTFAAVCVKREGCRRSGYFISALDDGR